MLCTCSTLLFRSVPVGDDDDDDDEGRTERNMAAVSPIPKIVTTPIKEDFSREDEDSRDEWGESTASRKVDGNDKKCYALLRCFLAFALNWRWRHVHMANQRSTICLFGSAVLHQLK